MSKPKKRKSTGAPIASAASRWLGDAAAERDLERELGPAAPPKTWTEARANIETLVIELGGRVIWAGQREEPPAPVAPEREASLATVASGGAEPEAPKPADLPLSPAAPEPNASIEALPRPPAPTITPLAPALEGLAHVRDDVTGRCRRCGMRVNEDGDGYCLH